MLNMHSSANKLHFMKVVKINFIHLNSNLFRVRYDQTKDQHYTIGHLTLKLKDTDMKIYLGNNTALWNYLPPLWTDMENQYETQFFGSTMGFQIYFQRWEAEYQLFWLHHQRKYCIDCTRVEWLCIWWCFRCAQKSKRHPQQPDREFGRWL